MTFSPDPPDAEEQKLLLQLFDPCFYLARYQDVREAGVDAFHHFVENGAFEGRSPHPLFDVPFYLVHHPEVAHGGMNPVLHFLRTGANTGANPHPLFDTAYYRHEYPDVLASGLNPLIHFIERGAAQGHKPHPFFNLAGYSSHPVTDLRIESLRRQLAIARMHVDYLKRQRDPLPGGKLYDCPDPIYLDRVYYCLDGKRHWVVPANPSVPGDPCQGHLDCYGLSLRDLVTVDGPEMRQYELAGPLPLPWPLEFWKDPVRLYPHDLRELSVSRLRGSGIEFGAGTGPLSLPLDCEVKYADLFSQTDLSTRAYVAQGGDFVPLTYVMGMEDMSAISDDSLNFVTACHVIEHLRNPLRAFEQVYRKLKPGGQYVLVVPEMRLMFDRGRALTTLDHLVEDFEKPSPERDAAHYSDFFSKVYSVPDHLLAQRVEGAIAGNHDLHFHTWTYESFGEMVKYAQRTMTPWQSVWSQPAIWEDPASHEFYFVLEK